MSTFNGLMPIFILCRTSLKLIMILPKLSINVVLLFMCECCIML